MLAQNAIVRTKALDEAHAAAEVRIRYIGHHLVLLAFLLNCKDVDAMQEVSLGPHDQAGV